MCKWVKEESSAMMKTFFPDAKQINQCPKSTLWKECTYVQEEKDEIEGNIDSPPDNEPTFSSSYFLEKPIVNVETVERILKEMNLHRVQQKGYKGLSHEYEKDRTVQHKNSKTTLPRITLPDMMDICEAECPHYISPVDMEEGVNDINYDKRKNAWLVKRGIIIRWHFSYWEVVRCKW